MKTKFEYFKKFFLYAFIASSLLSLVLSVVLYFSLWNKKILIYDIPYFEKDFFNGLINEAGNPVKRPYINPAIMIMSFWKLGNARDNEMIYITFLPFWIICTIILTMIGWIQKSGFNKLVVGGIGFFTFLFTLNIIIQLIFFLNPKIFEITIAKHIDFFFERNYLVKNVGVEKLNWQIEQTAKGLETETSTLRRPKMVS
ncbi:hypothetical protein [Spiroplasma alleghenense]|uniref:Transmembrane protein n=1 Tax=Spiroplasma alleghenense TaxID=216931 RepID=A0A345Z4P8_9MOLU|nr:hypothetical protein [Spiroplasma alleghenense]AXK51577.1 hypothetical protein SALLE_v1c09070 [Spiroplasma alleghenense]